LEYTGCDGVMSSEALLECPQLFDEGMSDYNQFRVAPAAVMCKRLYIVASARFYLEYPSSQLDVVDEYLDLCDMHPPRPPHLVIKVVVRLDRMRCV
jgi:tRNA-dihydrouridine synthase